METLLKILIPILIQIESGGDNNAIGDGGKAVGCLQQHEIHVDEANRIMALNIKGWLNDPFDYGDRFNREYAIIMTKACLKHHGQRRISKNNTELENLVILGRIHNGGPNGYKKKATLPYAKKITKLYKRKVTNE